MFAGFASISTNISAPKEATFSVNELVVSSAAIGKDVCISIGPVSSPSSIFINVTPKSLSPASIAREMGAAPRQRGKRLA